MVIAIHIHKANPTVLHTETGSTLKAKRLRAESWEPDGVRAAANWQKAET